VLAEGAAPADLRAPTVGIARTKAMRRARDDARRRLAAALAKVPGASLPAEAATSLADTATIVRERLGSDGSSVVTAAIGVDELRTAAHGPDRVSESSVDVIVVEVGKTSLAPRVGLAITAAGVDYRGPTLFARAGSRELD